MSCYNCENLDRRLSDMGNAVQEAIKEIDVILSNMDEGKEKKDLFEVRLRLGEATVNRFD